MMFLDYKKRVQGNYLHIEKEALVYGVKMFHMYLYG